jgi:bacteriocin-like protein
MKELSLNELKQVNGGMGPGEHIVAQHYMRKLAIAAIVLAQPGFKALSNWW